MYLFLLVNYFIRENAVLSSIQYFLYIYSIFQRLFFHSHDLKELYLCQTPYQ